ncbi:acbd6 [Symbiodinium sp. CCMP2592]|nr:acbd6 [Symbiodinium sp. CCMP2592]
MPLFRLPRFERAAAWVSEHGSGLSTSAALELYAWYKQATCGDCQGSQPFSMQGAAKWDAWNQVRGYAKEVAQLAYVKALEQYAPEWISGGALEETGAPPDRGDGLSMGPTVSTLGYIGSGNPADVDETPAGQLCQKIADGAVEEAFALLRQFPKLATEVDKDGMLPLHWAADRGDVEMVSFLLGIPDVKAHISEQDSGGDTPSGSCLFMADVFIPFVLLSFCIFARG